MTGRRAALALLAALLLWTHPAAAWEPLEECEPGLYSHWDVRPVGYRLNTAGSDDLSWEQFQTMFDAGFEAWETVCCSTYNARNDGTTNLTALDQSTQRIVSFAEDSWPAELGESSTVLGATLTVLSAGCIFQDADIVFNGVAFTWIDGNPSSSSEADLQSVATHEQGHWIGLGYSDVPAATMFENYVSGSATRSLDMDDVTGICTLYRAIEEHCRDGGDNDCDTFVDCADDDCVTEPACNCVAAAPLDCGGSVSGDTTGGVVSLDGYPCSTTPEPGPEVAYSFAPTFNGTITVDLSNIGATDDVDLLLTSGHCNPAFCLSSIPLGPGVDEQLVIDVTGDTTYYLVVDSPTETGATFDLAMTCVRESEAACDNGITDDEDALIDCYDVDDCEGSICGPGGATCVATECVCPGEEADDEATCNDGLDNDCDGSVDCSDETCDDQPCDLDGRICVGGACTCPGGTLTEVTCDDGKDNDCDTDFDCDDIDCFNQPCGLHGRVCMNSALGYICACPGGQGFESSCNDGNDNDCDGDVDCDDTDCDGLLCSSLGEVCVDGACVCVPAGNVEIVCGDGYDNDCDDDVDCDDSDCDPETLPPEWNCTDEMDSDCDGLFDCDDPDCQGLMACPPDSEIVCDDDLDNDYDGDEDCEDSDCELDPACLPEPDAGPQGDTDPPGDSFVPAGDTDGTAPPGGCGCTAQQEPGGTLGLLGLILVGVLIRRRQ